MKRRNSALSRVFTALVFVFLYAPIFLLIIFSFNAGNSNIVWSGFSLNWYRELLHNRLILRSVYTTLCHGDCHICRDLRRYRVLQSPAAAEESSEHGEQYSHDEC